MEPSTTWQMVRFDLLRGCWDDIQLLLFQFTTFTHSSISHCSSWGFILKSVSVNPSNHVFANLTDVVPIVPLWFYCSKNSQGLTLSLASLCPIQVLLIPPSIVCCVLDILELLPGLSCVGLGHKWLTQQPTHESSPLEAPSNPPLITGCASAAQIICLQSFNDTNAAFAFGGKALCRAEVGPVFPVAYCLILQGCLKSPGIWHTDH